MRNSFFFFRTNTCFKCINKLTRKSVHVLLLVLLVSLWACNTDTKNDTRNKAAENYTQKSPIFNADSAYSFINKQVAFGPRVPNSIAHANCGAWLANTLAGFGADTLVQRTNICAFNDSLLRVSNIIGQFNKTAKYRIMLMAHWDTRPFADQCTDSTRVNEPILGANDGAGGVGVLLEIARILGQTPPDVGVDIFLFDAEDYGDPDSYEIDSWCMGSTYWAKNRYPKGYKANYGILLDMVSGENVFFTKESHSLHFAPTILNKVWLAGERLGYRKHFSFIQTHFVGTDDHVPVNQIAKIPSIALIHYNQHKNGFANYWHTHNDNMDAVSKESLSVSGQTVLEVIYTEGK